MKNLIVLIALTFSIFEATAQEMKVITVIESIVPMGLGRSRIIENNANVDYSDFTTSRTNGKKSDQGTISRKNAKINKLNETKLLNFYSAFGINFQNVASNDALITSKINSMLKEGWSLTFVTSGVESVSGKDDEHGIFITRLFFSRK